MQENLFGDPAIVAAPAFVRRPLAALAARLRAPSARANYAVMGGGSPLLAHTLDQAIAVENTLSDLAPLAWVKVFVAMRYWRPDIGQVASSVARFCPDHVVLVPLYPQFSTTTTASSLAAWREAYRGPGQSRAVCCWFNDEGLGDAHAAAIRDTWDAAGRPPVRLLFSAHGVPQNIVAGGDPYQWQVETTCAAKSLPRAWVHGWDWRVCYQSRVGPLKWLGPSTPDAIRAAGDEGLGVLIDPVAFVCEHIETLVELDRDYAALARAADVPVYLRAPAIGTQPAFIEGLARTSCFDALERSGVAPAGAACPASFGRCGRRLAGASV